MNHIIFQFLRRMRAPLLALIVAYAVAVLGLVLIPGQDADGNPWRMDFFHAFYFVSYMSTTIGFGEIPHAFNAAQRLWVTVTIYMTVIVWLYSIGKLIALLQDPAFRQALTELRFSRRVRHLRDPFYLICGYGETGVTLVRALSEHHLHAVVLDIRPERVQALSMENLPKIVPALVADARAPANLISAGLKHRLCASVVALTDDNTANLKIAITSKLLRPELAVICRAESHDVEANMASFGTDFIFDPFDTFAQHLAINLQAPCQSLLHAWLTGSRRDRLSEPAFPNARGLWVLCGFGRFGKAIYQRLRERGIETIVIEAMPDKTGMPETGAVIGRGTEANTLVEADVRRAVGLVAGTDDDANNLSIIMTARELNPELFFIARQNRQRNAELFNAVDADIVMHPSYMVADRIRVLLTKPLLSEFVGLARRQDDDWACELISRISAYVDERAPYVWEVTLSTEQAYALMACWRQEAQQEIRIEHLLCDPHDCSDALAALVLMHKREQHHTLQPGPECVLRPGDQLLFCGRHRAYTKMQWTLQNPHVLAGVQAEQAVRA